jgi:hypothetical protein
MPRSTRSFVDSLLPLLPSLQPRGAHLSQASRGPMPDLATNVLYYGDNLDILRRYLPDAAVDLVSLDPPFNSNRDYGGPRCP